MRFSLTRRILNGFALAITSGINGEFLIIEYYRISLSLALVIHGIMKIMSPEKNKSREKVVKLI